MCTCVRACVRACACVCVCRVTNVRDTHYIIGSAIGPHPFPTIVRDFQSVI